MSHYPWQRDSIDTLSTTLQAKGPPAHREDVPEHPLPVAASAVRQCMVAARPEPLKPGGFFHVGVEDARRVAS